MIRWPNNEDGAMSIFGKMKEVILGSGTSERTTTEAPSPAESDPARSADVESEEKSVIDIENHLDAMPGTDRLNWRTSIVDLMKLIGVESDYESRKALANELGHAEYSGSAEDDNWLHRRTLRELSTN